MATAKKRISYFLLFVLLFSVPFQNRAGAAVRYVQHGARDDRQKQLIKYWLYAPPDIQPGMPLVVYLHGSGERGEGALLTSLPLFVKEGTVLCNDAILLVPQMPSDLGQWISIENALMKMIDRTVEEYGVDESRIALVGFSMGGIGVYDLVNLYPERFSRAVAVSGRVNDDVKQDAFCFCELRTFVGSKDTNMPPKSALNFAFALEEAGYTSEAVELECTHSRMPYHVFQDAKALEWCWLELAPKPTPGPSATPKPEDATDASGYRTLKKGMNGKDVQRFKAAMYWLGYFNDKNVSDEYNSLTEERVKKLQRYNGLEETGIADPALQALVFSGNAVRTETAPKPSKTPKPSETPKP
ncbi:MAG: peptidoglycan-binding protein [Clostridia bacterium]|nr:peptidoglycan-binding protein [Clostridia bacterium]